MNRRCGPGIARSLELQPDSFVAHPCISGENCKFAFAPRLFFCSCQPQLASAFLNCPVRNPYLICQLRNAWPVSGMGVLQIDFTDALVESFRENVLPSLYLQATMRSLRC